MIDAPGTGAASVAAQVLAFYREPARWRPRYIHGEEQFPEGHVTLKFALGRFSPGWHRDLSAHDRDELTQAARAFVRQVCLWERATPYQVLCLEPDADPDSIKENYRLMMALMHPDRLASAHEWPSNGAQRVNEAYAVLSDGARRREFDEGLAIKEHVEHVHVAQAEIRVRRAHAHVGNAGAGYLRRFLLVTGMLAAVFVVQALWMGDVPSHYALLERANPARAAHWMRDALPAGALPRFIEANPVIAYEPIELLAPSKLQSRAPSISLAGFGTVAQPGRADAPFVAAPAVPVPAPVFAAPSLPQQAVGAAPIRLAQATIPSAPAPAAAAPAPKGASAPSNQDVEILVSRLVSYYEAGDVDGLMSLFDQDELGFWQGLRTRSAYSEFFRASKQRRLRMDRLQWTVDGQTANAKGDATVVADMTDGSKLERKTDIALELRLRGGHARIARLALFPDSR